MGNDGGDIPGRKELVREKKKVELAPMQVIAMGRARFCNLTNNPLQAPLAICRLGNIYNYEQILGALAKKELPAKYAYIRKLTDIKQITIDRTSANSLNYIACPISKLQYNGFNKFVAFWPCGHVVSKKALKQVKSQNRQCIICQQPYDEKELIDMNLEGELLVNTRKALIQMRKKKEKKEQPKEEIDGKPTKKVKTDMHINTLDRLGGEFRDVIRARENFKGLFKKEEEPQWKKNTYFVAKSGEQTKEK